MPPDGAEETTGRPQQPTEMEWLFHLLADQHQASLHQVAANQNAANQHMWDRMAQLLASQQPAPTTPAMAMYASGALGGQGTDDDHR